RMLIPAGTAGPTGLHHPRHPRLDRLADELARVGDVAGQGARGNGQWAREVDRALGAAHAAGEVAVCGADAGFAAVEAAEGVGGAAEAGAAAAGADEAARVQQDVL